mmetsp:Transcript_9826/g.23396  ORF Transcript_9826/g.23396 Transcript_9826/m.23396 type:complete len:306 (+) Transcript_9826:105-1022(+)
MAQASVQWKALCRIRPMPDMPTMPKNAGIGSGLGLVGTSTFAGIRRSEGSATRFLSRRSLASKYCFRANLCPDPNPCWRSESLILAGICLPSTTWIPSISSSCHTCVSRMRGTRSRGTHVARTTSLVCSLGDTPFARASKKITQNCRRFDVTDPSHTARALSVVLSTLIPVSSNTSRCAACTTPSSPSTCPPGKTHIPLYIPRDARCVTSTSPRSFTGSVTAATVTGHSSSQPSCVHSPVTSAEYAAICRIHITSEDSGSAACPAWAALTIRLPLASVSMATLGLGSNISSPFSFMNSSDGIASP